MAFLLEYSAFFPNSYVSLGIFYPLKPHHVWFHHSVRRTAHRNVARTRASRSVRSVVIGDSHLAFFGMSSRLLTSSVPFPSLQRRCLGERDQAVAWYPSPCLCVTVPHSFCPFPLSNVSISSLLRWNVFVVICHTLSLLLVSHFAA